MIATSRNAPCPCGSGRKFKRCCADARGDPARIARRHDAVGDRIQSWAFEHHGDAMGAALREIVGGREDLVLGDIDLTLIASWALNDRELPGGGTPAQRYAQRQDLDAGERDVAGRIAAARLRLLRVLRVMPDRWIEFEDAAGGEVVRAVSHDVSRTARPQDVLVGRPMSGPPAPSLWGPVGFLTCEAGRELSDLVEGYMESLGVGDEPGVLAAAMHAASREITVLLAPGLRCAGATRRAA